jgi:hypothetical protein
MKRLYSAMFAALLCGSLVACGGGDKKEDTTPVESAPPADTAAPADAPAENPCAAPAEGANPCGEQPAEGGEKPE